MAFVRTEPEGPFGDGTEPALAEPLTALDVPTGGSELVGELSPAPDVPDSTTRTRWPAARSAGIWSTARLVPTSAIPAGSPLSEATSPGTSSEPGSRSSVTRRPITCPASRSGIASSPATGEIETASRSEAVTVVPTGTRCATARNVTGRGDRLATTAPSAPHTRTMSTPPAASSGRRLPRPSVGARRCPRWSSGGFGKERGPARPRGMLRPGSERPEAAVASGMA